MNYSEMKQYINTGLSVDQINRSREKSGSNTLTEKKRSGFWKQLLSSFSDPIIKILMIALAANVLLLYRHANWYETAGIAAAVFLATFVSTVSEYGSELAFRKLQEEASKIQCRVRRVGNVESIMLSDIVLGDVVLLSPGDMIPADGILIQGSIGVDQSALNGESREVHKYPVPSKPEAASKLRKTIEKADLNSKNRLFRGSVVAFGEGIMLVDRVGDATLYGKLASDLQGEMHESPLKERLTHLASQISRIGYAAAVLVVAADLFNELIIENGIATLSAYALTAHILHAVTLGITVVVVAVPEGLPMMITLVLSSNMITMMKNNVMVRKLVGIETAGSLNILFTDKTGTLTKGNLKVSGIIDSSGILKRSYKDLSTDFRRIVEMSFALNNGSTVAFEKKSVENDKNKKAVFSVKTKGSRQYALGGNATDRALLDFVLPMCFESLKYHKITSHPFNSTDKYSSVTVMHENRRLTLIKGAPEKIIPGCESCIAPDGSVKILTDSDTKRIISEMNSQLRHAMRIVAVALADENYISEKNNGLTFVCLAAIRDELRPEAVKAVSSLHGAGIQVVMVTGDNRDTAVAVAADCGIISGFSDIKHEWKNEVITGSELEKLSDEDIKKILPEIRVIARALPSDKSRLIRIAGEAGMVTGMTGDGVNDAPALKKADVGFAMGSGTEIAKEAGDIVILDNNIASIEKAVLYGRTIFKSIRKFIVFQLTMNLCAVGVSLIGPFIGIDTPVTVIQMLWINIIMDTLAGLAFAGEAPLRSYMKEKPKKRGEPVLNRIMVNQIAVTGLYTVILSIIFLKLDAVSNLFRSGKNDIYIMTAFFALFIFCGIFNSFNCRTGRINIVSNLWRNPSFMLIMLLVSVTQIIMMYFGGSVFRTAGLTLRELVTTVLIAASVIPIDIIRKIILRLNNKSGEF